MAASVASTVSRPEFTAARAASAAAVPSTTPISYRRRAEIVLPDRHETVAYLARPQAAIGAEEDSTHVRDKNLVDGCLPVRDRQLVEDLGAS